MIIAKSSNSGYFLIDGIEYQKNQYALTYDNIEAIESVRNFTLTSVSNKNDRPIVSRGYDEIQDKDLNFMTNWSELLQLLSFVGALTSNDVSIQDQTTPALISQINKKVGDTTLAAAVIIDSTQITVVSAVGIEVGHLIVVSSIDGRVYVGKVTDISGAPVLILDTPINFAFGIGTVVSFGTTELNVLGTRLAPVIFSARNTGGDIPVTFDITRIIFTIVTDSPVDLLKFGNLPILINGLVLRRKDGIISNIVNIKSNAAFANIAYDFTIYAATNPQQGVDGLVCRLTFAGQNKMGVAIRLAPDEDLELLIQDDLTTLTEFSVVIEGHVVE